MRSCLFVCCWVAACTPEATREAAVPPLDAGLPAELELQVVPGATPVLFLGLWGTADTDLWFVGGAPGPRGGAIAHFDGEVIRFIAAPQGPTLWWIHGPPLRAVGQAGRILVRRDDRWEPEPTGLPPDAILWGLWGTPDDLWAVGGLAGAQGPKGIVMRSRGDGMWTKMTHPALPQDTNLYKAWGTAPNDVHLVGEGGVALHWDGALLRRVETGTTELLFTVHGRPQGPILAVGGTINGVALLFDGTRWVDAGAPAGLPPFNGVFVAEDGEAIITGQRGVVLRRALSGTWTRLQSGGEATLHAAWRGSTLWAAGGDFSGRGGGTIATSFTPIPALDPGMPPPTDGGVPDARVPDAQILDARVADAHLPDARLPDADPPDARGPDGDATEVVPDARVDAAPDAQVEPPRCGDGRVDFGEACDDGGRLPGDGCDADCRRECGNGRRDHGELCDDGFTDACGSCNATCSGPGGGPGVCGDGALCPEFELCDDGYSDACGTCNATCLAPGTGPGVCGDRVVCREFEACDDGGRVDGDGCDPSCRVQCANPLADEERGVRLDWRLQCPADRQCFGLAAAGFLLYCTHPCDTPQDCGPDFGRAPCCAPAGPQLVDTYCVPTELVPNGCR